MADETNEVVQDNTQVLTDEEKATAVRLLFSIVFENIVPWGKPEGDTGMSSRLKLRRNFEKIKAWIDASPNFFLSRLYDDIAYGHIEFNKGITTNDWVDEEGTDRPALEVKGDSTFTGNLSSPEFVSEFFGGLGWGIKKEEVVNAAGVTEYKYTLEIDNATIRNTLRVFEMIVSQLLGENANRFFSDMMEVDHFDTETRKVWLKTKNGRLYNPFRVGDIILVQQYQPGNTGIEGGDSYVTKTYELRITAVGLGSMDDGENRLDWVEFDNFATTMENHSAESLIKEWDTFVRFDNDRDPNRKGLLSIMAVGQNTPYMDILYGMKTDPQHSLKGRLGNLEGVRTDLFGWLEGFGAYINNLYGVGKFYNHQTGEGLSARIEGTRQNLKSLYTESIYNISDDDNFILNGFFQRGLENWGRCRTDGTIPNNDDEEPEAIGAEGEPLLFNGNMLAYSSRLTAEATVKDGIRMLHLLDAGVYQDFSKIKKNSTHMELESSLDDTDTDIISVLDTLYMGIRILSITSGTLSFKFYRENGTSFGWQHRVDAGHDWQLFQAIDTPSSPWDYSGNGKLVVAYTGECYIRFVALQTDPIINSKTDYSTLFHQNSRAIVLQAKKQSDNLTAAVAEINIQYNHILQTVTDYKDAADLAFDNLNNTVIPGLSGRLGSVETSASNSATWISSNKNRIALIAAQFDDNGNLSNTSGLVTTSEFSTLFSQRYNATGIATEVASLTVAYNSISQTVSNNASSISALQTNYGSLNTTANSLLGRVGTLETNMSGVEGTLSAATSNISQLQLTANSLTTSVSKWNHKGVPINNAGEWESGSTSEYENYTYDQVKVDSNTRVRTKKLFGATTSTFCTVNSGYKVGMLFFRANKTMHSQLWSGWVSPDANGVCSFSIPARVSYCTLIMAYSDNRVISNVASFVQESGITITSDSLVTEAEISLFITENDLSNITIKADKIDFTFTVDTTFKAKNGSTVTDVMKIRNNGNLWIKGEFEGKITNSVVVGPSDTYKMYIRANNGNGAELVGVTGSSTILKLGFYADSNDNNIRPSLTLGKYSLFRPMKLRVGHDSNSQNFAELNASANMVGLYASRGLTDRVMIMKLQIDAAGLVDFSAYKEMWPTYSQVSVGGVYVDGDVLKVKL